MLFFYYIIIVSFIDTMAQLPILSPFVYSLGASSIMVGVIMAAYSFSNMLGNIGAGFLIDRYGRKIGIFFGMLVAGISVLLYTLVVYPEQLLFLRIIHGLGGAILIPAIFAYLGDRVSSHSTGKSMGFSAVAIGLAALIGPALAGFAKDYYTYQVIFVFLGTLLIFTSFLVLIFLPESYEKPTKQSLQSPKYILKFLLAHPKIKIAYSAAFSLTLTLGILAYAFPITLQKIGYSSISTGLFFSTFSLVAIIIFLLPLENYYTKYSRAIPIIIGLFSISFALFFLPLAHEKIQFILLMIFYGIGFGLIFLNMTSSIVENTESSYRGVAFGLFYALFSLGVFIGPLLTGIMYHLEKNPYYPAATFLIIIIIYIYYLYKKSLV